MATTFTPGGTDNAKLLAGTLLVYFDGNSLTLGTGSTGGNTYPAQTLPLLYKTVESYNLGISAQTTPQMSIGAPAAIDNASRNHPEQRGAMVVVAWEGTNDLYMGASATTAYNNLVTYCQDRRTAGFKVAVLTLLPRSAGSPPPSFETDRQTVNTNLRTNWATFADALVDPGGDATIGPAGAETNTTYYADLVHLTNAGYAIVAGLVAPVLRGLLA